MLEFSADIVRHGEAHIVLEVDMELSISASYKNIQYQSGVVTQWHLLVP